MCNSIDIISRGAFLKNNDTYVLGSVIRTHAGTRPPGLNPAPDWPYNKNSTFPLKNNY